METRYEVTASKVNQGEFGFDICYDETDKEPGFYISRSQVPTLVLRGHITQGDRILTLNGTEVDGLDPVELLDLVCDSPEVCTLTLLSGPFSLGKETRLKGATRGRPDEGHGGSWIRDAMERERKGTDKKVTVIMKRRCESFGFNITSFAKSEGRMEAKRFYVSEIVSEEAAEKLCLGDEIVAINGIHTTGRTHRQVVHMFMTSASRCQLDLRRSKWTVPREHIDEDEES